MSAALFLPAKEVYQGKNLPAKDSREETERVVVFRVDPGENGRESLVRWHHQQVSQLRLVVLTLS